MAPLGRDGVASRVATSLAVTHRPAPAHTAANHRDVRGEPASDLWNWAIIVPGTGVLSLWSARAPPAVGGFYLSGLRETPQISAHEEDRERLGHPQEA
jgi:hypothetical protein